MSTQNINPMCIQAIRRGRLNIHQLVALVLPVVLILTMLWVFPFATRRLGFPLGYLVGFGVYWVGWCVIAPALLLGGLRHLRDLFHPFPALNALDWQTHLWLWWPIIFPLVFVFVPRIRQANLAIVLASLALGIVIGVTEEVLWRGVYWQLFPGNFWLGILYPNLLFALWHLAPQTVVTNRLAGGAFSFIAYAFVLGISYARATRRTGSIGWSTLSHMLHDALGLGGFAYAVWLK